MKIGFNDPESSWMREQNYDYYAKEVLDENEQKMIDNYWNGDMNLEI